MNNDKRIKAFIFLLKTFLNSIIYNLINQIKKKTYISLLNIKKIFKKKS